MAAALAEEREAPEPWFPHRMSNTATAYASSANTDVAACEDLPGHHLLAVRNLITTTNDESYHGSASELPPATSHGYMEWDFSGVPDPVMF
jgi:predicted RNase H-like HicB family nuclease